MGVCSEKALSPRTPCRPACHGYVAAECRLFEPIAVEVLDPFVNPRHRLDVERCLPGDHQESLDDGRVGAVAGHERPGDGLEKVRAVGQELVRLSEVAAAQ